MWIASGRAADETTRRADRPAGDEERRTARRRRRNRRNWGKAVVSTASRDRYTAAALWLSAGWIITSSWRCWCACARAIRPFLLHSVLEGAYIERDECVEIIYSIYILRDPRLVVDRRIRSTPYRYGALLCHIHCLTPSILSLFPHPPPPPPPPRASNRSLCFQALLRSLLRRSLLRFSISLARPSRGDPSFYLPDPPL